MENKESIVISLGGSLIIPDQINILFLKEFKSLIIDEINKGKKFVIITGGGKICRRYQQAAKELSNPSNEDLDWIGISSLKLNAELLRVIFKEYANKMVVSNFEENFEDNKPITIGSAYKIGQSTDWDAVLAAKRTNSSKIINLSNTDYVYSSDPKINTNAKKIEKISWVEYRKLIPETWDPGLNTPFDPIASREAESLNLEVIVLNGNNIENIKSYLDGLEFIGTVIK